MPDLMRKSRQIARVLARLRHHAFVGGDDEERQVYTAHTGQHVLDEALVAPARPRSRW
jgi:hypothetical protein